MKLNALLRRVNTLETNVEPDIVINNIRYDSRLVEQGDMFIAIKGFEMDGHRFIPAALERGAAVVICEDLPPGLSFPYIRVENSRLALALVSCEYFGNPADKMKVIGITGTNGKTTTTYLVKHILEDKLSAKVGLIGTNGNMIGDELLHSERTTPESYELQELFFNMYEAGCSHVVMEVSSHAISLDRVAGFGFEVAVFTNLTQDHLDFHGDMESYASAKKELFYRCKTACINLDDEWSGFILKDLPCPVITSSVKDNSAALVAKDIRLSSDSVRFVSMFDNSLAMTKLAIPGMFSVHNALSALSVGLALGLDIESCAAALSCAEGVKGRVENVPTDGDYSIIIDYSHTPDSLYNILKTLRPVTKGRLICLFGCGGDRDKKKRPIMGAIASENSDICIVTSDNPRTEEPMAIINDILEGIKDSHYIVHTIPNRIEAIHWAIDNALAGDVILLAGKGQEDYQEIGHVKYHMDEREIVADYLRKRKTL